MELKVNENIQQMMLDFACLARVVERCKGLLIWSYYEKTKEYCSWLEKQISVSSAVFTTFFMR